MASTRPVVSSLLALLAIVGSVATAGGARASADIRLCDRYATTTVQGGRYVVQNNEWNDTTRQCLDATSDGFAVSAADHRVATDGPPAAYPSIYAGCHYGTCSTGTGLPLQVGRFAHPRTSVHYTTVDAGDWDAAYDIWFDTHPNPTGHADGAELMIWGAHRGAPRPAGRQVDTVTIDGVAWQVWHDGANDGRGRNVISYVRAQQTNALDVDIQQFTSDADARGYLDPDWYLTSVQFGFEPWVGGQGLAVDSFGFAAGADHRRYTGQALRWHTCASAADFECASLRVPLDYDEPHGATIDVAMIRHLATDPSHRAGTVFWNPGGPGGPGVLSLPAFYPMFSATLRARFDLVSFDPRGLGQSAQLHCFGTPAEENAVFARLPAGGVPIGPAEEQRTIDVYATMDRGCVRHGGPIQYHMSTANVARDMDRMRAALGQRTLSFYGLSYGTYLGETYANLFPAHAGRILLDGDVPPMEWNDAPTGAVLNTFQRIESPLGTETALRMMLRECGSVPTDRCSFSAGTPTATLAKYRTLLHRLRSHPAQLDGQTYTYGFVVSAVGSLLTGQDKSAVLPGWKALADLLQALWTASAPGGSHQERVDLPAQLRAVLARMFATPLPGRLSDGFPDAVPEGTYGVLCSESPNPRDPHSYHGQAEIGNGTAPDGFGSVWAWTAEPCAQWRARDTDRYAGPWNRYPKPYLLVGTLGDPDTAYVASLRTAGELPHTRLLTQTGGGHSALVNKSRCTDGHIDAFFLTGALPRRGTVCDQDQPPF